MVHRVETGYSHMGSVHPCRLRFAGTLADSTARGRVVCAALFIKFTKARLHQLLCTP